MFCTRVHTTTHQRIEDTRHSQAKCIFWSTAGGVQYTLCHKRDALLQCFDLLSPPVRLFV